MAEESWQRSLGRGGKGLAMIVVEHARLPVEERDGSTREDNYMGEAAGVASSYAWAAHQQIAHAPEIKPDASLALVSRPHQSFRWHGDRWQPDVDPRVNLARCAAYCAAEIDRLEAERTEQWAEGQQP